MNERIKELAEQNGFINRFMPPGEQYELLQRYEKFAELIVRECASVVYRDMDRAKPIWCSDKILKHFGVE